MDTSNAPQFQIFKINRTDNGIGGFIETEIKFKTIRGFLDMVNADEKTTYNSFIRESTHILLTDYTKDITNKMIMHDEFKNRFQVVYVDDPVSIHHHLEIYLRFVGDFNV